MQLPQLVALVPLVDEDGTVWDKYYVQTMTITTSVYDNKTSLYAEYWPCRDVVVDGVATKAIKTGLVMGQIKTVFIEDVFAVADADNGASAVLGGMLQMLSSAGVQHGFLVG